ncbi:hypothetical protein N9937_02275 [bacterium]|nr:hypothetical protein [bacterium]
MTDIVERLNNLVDIHSSDIEEWIELACSEMRNAAKEIEQLRKENAELVKWPVVPDGYAVVPVEPTAFMMLKVLRHSAERYGATYQAYGPVAWHYKAMLEAAKEEG